MLAEGDPEEAEHLLREALAGYREAHSGYLLPLVLGELASAQHARGMGAGALAAVREGLVLVDANEERSDEAPLLNLEGKILLTAGGHDHVRRAEDCFRRATAVAHAQDARLFELRAASSLARLWAEQGRRQKAREFLAQIYGWFTEGFETVDLVEAKALLDELA